MIKGEAEWDKVEEEKCHQRPKKDSSQGQPLASDDFRSAQGRAEEQFERAATAGFDKKAAGLTRKDDLEDEAAYFSTGEGKTGYEEEYAPENYDRPNEAAKRCLIA